MEKKKMLIIVSNIILGIIKFIIIAGAFLAAFIDDYVEPLSKAEQYFIVASGIEIAIFLDLIINYVMTKIINNKLKRVKYLNLVIISIIITIIESIIISIS